MDCSDNLPCLPSHHASITYNYDFMKVYNKHVASRQGQKHCINSDGFKLSYPMVKKGDMFSSVSGHILEGPHTGGGKKFED